MINYILLLAFCLSFISTSAAIAQNHESVEPSLCQAIKFSIGTSTHYSGDKSGFIFSSEYDFLKINKFTFSAGIGGSTHSREFNNMVELSGGVIDGSLRMVTSGLQINTGIGYNFLKSRSQELQLKASPFLRYQSRSNMDEIYLWYPALTGWDVPVWEVYNHYPQNILTIGTGLNLVYSFSLNSKVLLGAQMGYQMDLNGDNISQISLILGRKFN